MSGGAAENRADPTPLTTALLLREVEGLEAKFNLRFEAVDKATDLLHENMTRVPTDTDRQISHLREFFIEKFTSIQKQFDERDIRSRASEQSAETAVNAALQAQKEAAGKSEVSTVKQIDGLGALMASSNEAMNDKISAINSRLDRGDGKTTGITATTATMLAVAALLVSIGAAFFGSLHQAAAPIAVAPAVIPLQPK